MLEHNFKKKFGQNFISDKNLLEAIANDAEVDNSVCVLEIGAGWGSLTEILDKKAKKVKSFEIDKDLEEHLISLNLKNTTFIFNDIMKVNMEDIENNLENYKMVANLPYYITTPIIFKFLKESKNMLSMTIMVQKEVGNRICAKCGNKDYGVLSIMVEFYGKAKINRIVGKDNFYPKPKVDSCIVTIKIEKDKFSNIDGQKFYEFIQNSFFMRRKTLKNNLFKFYKEKIQNLNSDLFKKRPEELSLNQFIEIYNLLKL